MKKIIHKIKVYPKVEKLYEPFYQKRRVAIYARVSTSSDEQLNSIEAQRDYYIKYVEERSDLSFVKLYADVYSDRQTPFARSFRSSITEGEIHPHGS